MMYDDPIPPDPGDIPKKRTRPDVAERKARNKLLDFTCISVKWNTLCKNDILRSNIEEYVLNINKVGLEAYHIANLHILRCLSNNITLPSIEQTFFYRCCAGVVEKKGERSSTPNTGDSDLDATLVIYKRLRPETNYTIPTKENMADKISYLARDMNTVSHNHLIFNFEKRLMKYVRLKYKKGTKDAWQFINHAFKTDSDRSDDQVEFANWLVYPPYESSIKLHFNHFLQKSYDILRFMEEQPKNTKGARSFTILPLKRGFVFSHITLGGSCLQQILRNIMKKHKGVTFVGYKKLNLDTFNENKDEIWRSLFNIDRYETSNRKFSYEISTNGYSATIKMERLKSILPEVHISAKLCENDYDCFIGADPGVDYVLTAHTSTGKFVQISTAEYRHMAQMRKQLHWNNNVRSRNPEYAKIIKDMPSFMTTNVDTYMDRLSYVLKNCDYLFSFSASKGFRKWRFKTYIHSRSALTKLCKRLTGGEKRCCVGVGDWSRQDGMIKRHPTAPVKRIQKELQRHAKVVSIDEYGTSRSCSCCGNRCTKIKLPKQTKEGNLELSRCHQVVRCSSNECAMCWQRDINSSINHLKLLMCLVRGEDRPDYMRRS